MRLYNVDEIGLRRMSFTNNNLLTSEQVVAYNALIDEAKDFVNDPIMYKINLLLALFQVSML